ncbi:restriction endonuclease subunit S domain-containing protein [Clostridium estertheticum]|uniref:Restriction endonuclease subunit S n=2 Tax=Clostridium estertheticum TaxID=238834 RepID=A0A1J0GD72_9CLOT|nr:restriction endonuclease subunit S [Clostridium estertheticum]APC39277.1 hypothetical protein A7L45_03975 [Clostridium estertheticum subsp. estertheticum]WAG74642.1 restriction endonuclease subunit S [Clostridium estertheticum]
MKHMSYFKLGDSSTTLNTGLVISRKKSEDDDGYKYKILTLRSFNENGYLDTQYLDGFISNEKLDDKQITQEGDIIVRLSYPNTAIYIPRELEGIVVTSLFIIIRIKTEYVLPKYVQIYLNSENVKRQLVGNIIGSVLSIVKASSFREIEIPIYPVEYQDKVIDMNELILKEKKLLNKLIEKKTMYHKGIMRKMFE